MNGIVTVYLHSYFLAFKLATSIRILVCSFIRCWSSWSYSSGVIFYVLKICSIPFNRSDHILGVRCYMQKSTFFFHLFNQFCPTWHLETFQAKYDCIWKYIAISCNPFIAMYFQSIKVLYKKKLKYILFMVEMRVRFYTYDKPRKVYFLFMNLIKGKSTLVKE